MGPELSKVVDYRLKYPAEPQNFTKGFTIAFYVFGILWITFITLVNVATVGYELVPTFSTSFNGSVGLWYEKVLPTKWRPVTRSCEPTSFPLGKNLITDAPGSYFYTLVDFENSRSDVPLDTLVYGGTTFQNCAVTSMSLSSTTASGLGGIYLWCNTTSEQVVGLQMLQDAQTLPGNLKGQWLATAIDLALSSKPLNISDTATLWFWIASAFLNILAPTGLNPGASSSSLFVASIFGKFSSFTIGYSEYYESGTTIASGNWYMSVGYSLRNSSNTNTNLIIQFTPTGDTVPSAELDKANAILADIINPLRFILQDPSFDIWRALNWVFIVLHWATLHNFGQIAPIYYPKATTGVTVGSSAWGDTNFSAPAFYSPATYNIFYNETLFNIYSDYLNNVLYKFAARLNTTYGTTSLPVFLPVNDQNRLQAAPVAFVTSYACTERQLKGWLNFIVSVIVADYTFIMGAYTLFIFLGQQFERFQEGGKGRVQAPVMTSRGEKL